MKKLNDCFVDTVKIHTTGKKYNVYFYAVMCPTILTSLDDLRATNAAYRIFTWGGASVSLRASTPGSSRLVGRRKGGEICFWTATSIFHPSTCERLPAEDR